VNILWATFNLGVPLPLFRYWADLRWQLAQHRYLRHDGSERERCFDSYPIGAPFDW
jgi:hypothetical protein